MLNYPLLLSFTESFYQQATHDMWIGFHFRHIQDFGQHIPRIADFWHNRLGLSLHNPSHLPFQLIEAHRPLKLTVGQINRWVVIFQSTLAQFRQQHPSDEWERLNQEMLRVRDILVKGLGQQGAQQCS